MHAGLVVPTGVDRVEMAAHGRLVQHVVVDERGRVDHFHGRRQENVVRPKTAAGQPAQQQQGRPQPLATEAKAVFYQVVDEGGFAPQYLPEDLFDLMKPHLDGCIQYRQNLGCLDPVLGRLFHERLSCWQIGSLIQG